RHIHIQQHEVEGLLAQLLQGRLTVLRVVDLVSLSCQRDAHDSADLRIIIDPEDTAGTHRGQAPRGSEILNIVPVSAVLDTVNVPPCARAICCTMANPIPVPGMLRAPTPR